MDPLPATEPYVIGHLIGFTTGLVVSILLVVLTLRAAHAGGTPLANSVVALCAVAWNIGGLTHIAAQLAGIPKGSGPALIASAVQYSSAAIWPVPILAIWDLRSTRGC